MTTAELGDGSVPVNRMKALAGELHLLKSAMSDMQGRIETLLVEIGNEAQPAHVECEPSDRAEAPQDAAQATPTVETPVEIEPVTAIDESLGEIADTATADEIVEAAIVADAEIVAAEAIEIATQAATSTDIDITSTEPAIELAADEIPVEVAQIEAAAEPIALAEVSAEAPVEVVAETAVVEGQPAIVADAIEMPAAVEATAVAAVPENVVPVDVLVERRDARKGRSAAARVGRWAAAIALIAICAGLVATGTGFAGHGEILTAKSVCALAGNVCSIVPGIP